MPEPSDVVIAAKNGVVTNNHDTVQCWNELDPGRPLMLVGELHGRSLLPAAPYDDLGLMGWVLEPWSKPDQLSFRGLARWLKTELPPFEHLAVGEPVSGRTVLVDTARRLHRYLRLHLEQEGLWELYERVERPMALLLRQMEQVGVPVVRGAIDLGAEKKETRRNWRGWPSRWTSLSGRVHPHWHQTNAVTGRISAQNPSLQSLPRRLRDSVAAPKGRLLVAADLSGADFRAAAAMSRDPVLLGMYERGQDPYVAIGAGAGREARRKEREVGKRVALAALYGAKPSTLAQDLQLTVEAVELAIGSYRARFPRLWQWRDELLDGYYEGKELRNPFGRRLVPEAYAQVINHPCQSSVADIIKLAMLRLDERLPAGAPIVAQIHDEVVIECAENDADAVASLVAQEMTRPLSELRVPLVAKVGIGKTWKDAVHGQQ